MIRDRYLSLSWSLAILFVWGMTILSPLGAQEMAPPDEKRTEEDKELDAELLDSLGRDVGEDIGEPSGTKDSPNDPILRIADSMRNAEKLMENQDTTGAVSEAQQKVVKDLEDLIQSLKNQKKKKQPSPSQGSSSKDSQRKDPNQSDSAASQAGKGKENPDANESTEDIREKPKPIEEELDSETLARNLWGQLPAKARELMKESPIEEFLPEFQLEIEQYYRRLAEESPPK